MRRVRLWLLSSVVIGLLPLALDMIHNFDLHQHQDWHAALATGDALVLSAALAGGCVYDLLTRKRFTEQQEDTRNFLVVSAVIAAAGAALWFSDMHNNAADAKSGAPWTLIYLLITIAICVRALCLAYDVEVRDHRQPTSRRGGSERA